MHWQESHTSKHASFYEGPFQVVFYDQAAKKYTLEHVNGTPVSSPADNSQLKLFHGDPQDDEGEDVYDVWRIEDVHSMAEGQEYKVKWKGYKERTWEKEDNLQGAPRAIENFWRKRDGPRHGGHTKKN